MKQKAEITVVGGKRVLATLDTFSDRLRREMMLQVARGATVIRDAVRSRAQRDLRRRSGDLEKSIVASDVESIAHSVQARIGSNLVYARIQERGGTVRPTSSRYLAIPLAAMRTGKGVAKARARRVIANPGAFGFSSTFFAKHILFGRNSGGEITPLFALKKKVRLEGHHYFEHGYQDAAPRLRDQLAEAARRILSDEIS